MDRRPASLHPTVPTGISQNQDAIPSGWFSILISPWTYGESCFCTAALQGHWHCHLLTSSVWFSSLLSRYKARMWFCTSQ